VAKKNLRFRDRIVELRRIPASELLDNPENWRRHGEEQTSALTSMMERIGFAGAAIGVEREGRVKLLDGHLRKSIAGNQVIPVLITDLTDDEAKVFLATYDPLTDMAIADAEALRKLLADTAGADDDAYLRKLIADVDAELADDLSDATRKPKVIEGMALEPHEHYDYLVVLCQTTHEWNVLCDRLGLKPEARRTSLGTSRAIRATKLLALLAKEGKPQ
jgi:hypothetical protein